MTLGPTPPALFVGHERERERIADGLVATPMAVILGLAGVGKSALASVCAAAWKGPVLAVQVETGKRPAPWFGDLRRELRRRTDTPEAPPALVLVDHVHRVPLAERGPLLAELARCLGRSRAMLTSRERLPVAEGYDRFEIHLKGIGLRSARRLWQLLDECYGKQEGFHAAWRASAGNPAMLRRAHSGTLTGDHPLVSVLDQLPPDQVTLLAALALVRVEMTGPALMSLLDGERGEIALSALRRGLLVELDGAGASSLDELVRRMVRERLRGRDSALAPAVHRLLPAALARTGLDPAALACETIHHLGRAGEWDQAAAHLARQAGALIEQGASAELLRCLADLPPDVEARHPPLAPWRARGRLRMLELREAEAEIRRALTLPGAHRLELLLLLARVLLLHGALDEAGRTLAEAAAEPAEPAEPAGSRRAQASLAMIAAMVRCYRDDEVPAACSDLAAAAARLPDQATRLRATAASLRWLDHYGSGLVESGAAVPLEKPQRTVGLRAAALLPIATSRLGGAPGALVLETDAALRLSESRMRRHRDVLSRVHLSAVRIVRLWEQGLRVEGLAELEAAVETARRLEYRVAALWLEVWSARALFTLGRRVDAEARLAASTLQADRMGMRWIARAAAGARAQEPVARFVTMVRHGDLALAPASPRIRALAVLAAAAAGETSRVDALRRASGEEMARPGFGVERALDALAGGTLSLLRGDAEAYGQALERARAALAGDGADSDLLDRLLVVLGDVVVTASGRRIALGGSAPPSGGELRGGIVLDRETGELRAPSGVIPFARRHVLRRLLYRMALCPGEVVSKEILAQAVWDVGYHPLRHDNALFVNIHRLRVLLDGTGLEVASREDGYSLSAPPGFRFIKGVRDGPVRGSAAGRPSADR